jgi:hypothetical protein
VKTKFLAQHDQELEMVEASDGKAGFPCSANIDNEAAGVLENSAKLLRKRPEQSGN